MAETSSGQPAPGREQHTVARTELKARAIGLPGVLMQGVTAIAPAIAGMFTIPFIVPSAGVTFALAPIYMAANVGLYLYYRKNHPQELHWFKHIVIPVIGTIALGPVVYYSVNPLPAYPVSLAPFVVLGWILAGIAILAWMVRSGRASLLAHAKDAVLERVETPEEHAARAELI